MVISIKGFVTKNGSPQYSISYALDFVNSAIFYFVPAVDNILVGSRLSEFFWSKKGVQDVFEMSIYLGLLPTSLILWCFFQKRLGWDIWQRKVFYIGFTTLGVAFFLSLGPREGWAFSLNRLFFEIAPMFRHICRYQIVVIALVILLMSLALSHMVDKFLKSRWKQHAIMAACSVILFAEYNSYKSSYVLNLYENMPTAYKELKKIPGKFSVIDLPNSWWRVGSYYSMFQIFHEKPLGYKIIGGKSFDIYNPKDHQAAYDSGARYVIVNRKLPEITQYPLSPKTGQMGLVNFMARPAIGHMSLVNQWEDSALYKLQPSFQVGGELISYSKGFYIDHDQGSQLKWTSSQNAEIVLTAGGDSHRVSVGFRAWSLTPKTIEISSGQKTIGRFLVTRDKQDFSFILDVDALEIPLLVKQLEPLDNVGKLLGNSDTRNVGIFMGLFSSTEVSGSESVTDGKLNL